MTTETPSILRIVDGELVCKDGRDIREYLRNYATKQNITEDTPVVLMQRSGYKILYDAYYMLSGWAA